MFPEALATLKSCEQPDCLATRAEIYGLSEKSQEARNILDQIKEYSRRHYVFPTIFARAFLAAGEKEQALMWLERAYEENRSEGLRRSLELSVTFPVIARGVT